MAEVVVQAGSEAGLAHMIAGLIEGNLAAHADRERLLASRRAVAQIDVVDSGVVVGLKFVPGAVTVTDTPMPGPDLRIAAAADLVLSLTTVPLRMGLPDPATADGREVVRALLSGRLRVRGLPRALGLMRAITRLLSVA